MKLVLLGGCVCLFRKICEYSVLSLLGFNLWRMDFTLCTIPYANLFFFFRLPSKHYTAVERTLYGDIREFGQIARPPELIFMPPDRLAIIAIWPAEVMIQIKRRAAFARLICSELS